MAVERRNPQLNKSALKVFDVLRVLERNFAQGYTASELAEATGLSPSDITRYVATLEEAGYAERIPETQRIRPAMRYAKVAMGIMSSVDKDVSRATETKSRLLTGLNHV